MSFWKEKELCESFRENKENKSVYKTCNVSSEGIVVWVHFDKEDNWDWGRGELILSTLIKQFKLDKIGYNAPNVLRYKSPPCDLYGFTCKYYSPCPNFDCEVFFFDESFKEYSNDCDF